MNNEYVKFCFCSVSDLISPLELPAETVRSTEVSNVKSREVPLSVVSDKNKPIIALRR